MNRLKVWLVSTVVVLLTLVATAGAASACSFLFYEPQLPTKLVK